MSKLFWYIIHSFLYTCLDEDVKTVTGNWNEVFPDHFTPKHTCKKCGREWLRGIVYPDEPWPKPPNRNEIQNSDK